MRSTLFGVVLLAPAIALAQDPSKVPGKWRAPKSTSDAPSTPAERALHSSVLSVYEVFHATPTFAKPMGFEAVSGYNVSSSRRRDWSYDDARYQWPLRAGGSLGMLFHWVRDGVVITGEGETTAGVDFEANGYDCAIPDALARWAQDSSWFVEPKKTGEEHGFPVYEGKCVVMTRRTAALWRPVERERVMRAWLEDRQKALAEVEPLEKLTTDAFALSTVKELRETVARLKGQLAAMSPTDRQKPAYLDMAALATRPLVDAPSETAVRVVERNPALFDDTRPGDLQLLSLHASRCNPADMTTCPASVRVFDRVMRSELDWAALFKLVK